MTTDKLTIRERTRWLDSFNEGHRAVRAAVDAMQGQVVTLREAGLDGVADRLVDPLTLAREGVETMDAAVSRMIHEDAQASFNQIGQTFGALLQATGVCMTSEED